MEMGLPTRPRLIDRLRLHKVITRHFGDEDSEAAINALQDEFSETTTHHDIAMLMVWLRAEINGALVKGLVGVAAIGGLLLAISKVF